MANGLHLYGAFQALYLHAFIPIGGNLGEGTTTCQTVNGLVHMSE